MKAREIYWISYFISVFVVSCLTGYLLALCSCNTSMGTGMLFALLCYLLLAVVIVFHNHKICKITVGKGFLLGAIFGVIGGVLVYAFEGFLLSNEFKRTIAPSYFMEWFIVVFFIGLMNLLGLLLFSLMKRN